MSRKICFFEFFSILHSIDKINYKISFIFHNEFILSKNPYARVTNNRTRKYIITHLSTKSKKKYEKMKKSAKKFLFRKKRGKNEEKGRVKIFIYDEN